MSRLPSIIPIALAALLLACGDSDSPNPAPSVIVGDSPIISTTPAPSATPTIVVPTDATPIRFGGVAPFPDDVALIIETGCWQCDGSATGYWRVYRDPSGKIRADKLGPTGVEGSLHGFTSNALAGGMAMAFCTRGECSGFNPSTGDEQNTTYWSRDGGITWTQLAVTDGFFSGPSVVLRDGVVVSDDEDGLVLLPAGTKIVDLADPARGPYAASPTELAWVHSDAQAIVAADGSELLRVTDFRIASFVPLDGVNGKRRYLLLPRAPEGTPTVSPVSFVTALADGTIEEQYTVAFHQSTALGRSDGGSRLFGNTDVDEPLAHPYLPSIIDSERGTLSLIEEHFASADGFMRGRNHIRDVVVGPFARVVASGDCVNVRTEPSPSAQALDCTADGVLLVDLGESRDAEGAGWRRVATPAGVEGWASEEFLER